MFIRQGWQCPICGRVYSPTTPMCMYCKNERFTASTTVGDIPSKMNTITKSEIQLGE